MMEPSMSPDQSWTAMIAEDALGYKAADRHHGKTGLRDMRKNDIANELDDNA